MSGLAFVTSAGPAIGWGHLVRTMTMAAAAARRGEPAVVYLPLGAPRPASVPDGVSVVPTGFDEQGLGASLRAATPLRALLLDLPDEDAEVLAWLPFVPSLRVAYRMFGPPAAGAVEHVSLTPEFRPPTRQEHPAGHLPRLSLLGWNLIVVRPSLFAPPDEAKDDPPVVLVTMGGADPHGLTELACRDLLRMPLAAEVLVVVGASNPRGQALRSAFGRRFQVVDQGTLDFDAALRRASLAVISGGLTRYECIAARTPFLAISIHARQQAITEQVTRHGFGRHLGVADEIVPGSIVTTLDGLLLDPAARAAMVDAVGGHLAADVPERVLASLDRWQAYADA